MGGEATRALSEALRVNTTLTELDLGCEQQSSNDNQCIVNFNDISDNKIGGEGTHALSEALKVNTALTTLSLAGEQQQKET